MEVPSVKNSNNKEEIIETFIKKYEDHGFAITQKILRDLKFDFSFDFNDDEIENMIYDIHDTVLEFMEENNMEALISTPNGGYVALYGSEYEEERSEDEEE